MEWDNDSCWLRGAVADLKEMREFAMEQWRLRNPHKPKPLGCVDCVRATCYPDCAGPHDDPRIKRFLVTEGTTSVWRLEEGRG